MGSYGKGFGCDLQYRGGEEMSGTIKRINDIDEYMRDGDDPPSLYGRDYLPLEPTYRDTWEILTV
jgi:hypothetical protein